MNLVESIGMLGGLLTTLCWVPQVRKAVYGRDTRSISLLAFIVLSIGTACWLIYGIALGNLPLICANGVSLALELTILGAKLRYG